MTKLNKSLELAQAGILYAPASFLTSSVKELELVCNGCGAANSKFDFIPDSIYGLKITAACNIHDWMYHEGRTIEDKDEADRTFLNNLLRLFSTTGNRFLKWLRRRRAYKYYEAVAAFGWPAYWSDKQ